MALVTKSIGTTGRDYSTWTLWEAALGGAAGGAGNDARGESYNDSDFDETVSINDSTPDSIVLTVAAGERHDGTAGTGVRMLASVGSRWIVLGVTSKECTVEWIEHDVNGKSTGAFNIGAIHFDDLFEATVANCIVHDIINSTQSAGIRTRLGASSGTQNIINNIVYDILCTTGSASHHAKGVQATIAGGRSVRVYNNTAHNVRKSTAGNAYCIQATDGASIEVKNNIATDPGGTTSGSKVCYTPTSPVNVVMDYNLASDDTDSGANSIGADDGVITANQYVSTVGGSEDLHLKAGADAIDAGLDLVTTPSGVEIDINGRDRDAQGDIWDMGAHELVSAANLMAMERAISRRIASRIFGRVN